MNTPGIVTLEESTWDELSRLWPGPRSLLSPLQASGASPLSPAQSQEFMDAGWIEPSGQIAGYLREALESLASTRSLAELTFASHGSPVTCAVYFNFNREEQHGGARTWGMITDEQDRTTLCNAETARDLAAEYMSSIAQENTASAKGSQEDYFGAALQPAEAWILAVMLDMQRQSALLAAAQNPSQPLEAAPCVCQAASISKIISNIGNPQNGERALAVLGDEPGWVVLFFLSGIMQPVALSQEQVHSALQSLADAKHVMPEGAGYRLENGPARFANQFLAPEDTAFLQTCEEHDEQLDEDQLTCLRYGRTFLYALVSQQVPDRIYLSAGTSRLLADATGRALDQPISLASAVAPGSASTRRLASMPPSSPPAAPPAKRRASTRFWLGLGAAAILSLCCIAGGIALIMAS